MHASITIEELQALVQLGEKQLEGDLLDFWNSIKLEPVKWGEYERGYQSGGFWVVAICRKKLIWYNDLEQGFNISDYKVYGHIAQYYREQDPLVMSVAKLFSLWLTGKLDDMFD